MLTEETKTKIAQIVEKSRGYTITDWGEISGRCYKPFSQKVKNGREGNFFLVNVHENKGVYFYDFTEDTENGYIDIDAEEIDIYKEPPNNVDKERSERFKEIFDSIKFTKIKSKHPLFKQKNLKPFTSLYADKIKFKKECVVIPFYDAKTNNLIGAQVRPKDLSKWTIPFSKTKNGYFKLQEGKPCPNTNITNVFIGESYTTMSEIAEARKNDTCICTAGISQVLNVAEIISELPEYGNSNIIIVMDKEANGTEISKFEKNIIYTGYDWGTIQLDKHSNSTIGLTDFNEYQLKYGKEAVQKEINDQCSLVEVKMPEVIGYDNGEFKFVSPISRTVETVPELKILTRIKSLMNNATLTVFKKREAIPEPDWDKPNEVKIYNSVLRSKLASKFLKDFKKIQKTVPRELGIYKDENEFIANLKGGRFKYDKKDDKIIRLYDIVPNRKHIYVDNNTLPIDCDFNDLEFEQEDLTELENNWKELFNTKNKTPLYLLLGYCVQACYSGLSPFRSHMWITGSASSGKSTIKNNLIMKLTERLCESATDLTVAAVDQELGGDGVMNAVLYAIDEAAFSGGTKKRDRLMSEIIQLARDLAYNDGKEAKKRGTQGGVRNNAYHRTASFLLASVEHTLKDNQDVSRFIRFDIEEMGLKMNTDGVSWKKFEKCVNNLQNKFIATLIRRAHLYNEYYEHIFKEVFKLLGDETWVAHSRMAASACLSGLGILLHNGNVRQTSKKVIKLMKKIILKQKENQIKTLNNRVNVIDTILGTELNFNGVTYSCKEYLAESDKENLDSTWERYGLGYDNGSIIIRDAKFNVEKFFNVFKMGNVKIDISKYDLSCLVGVDKRVQKGKFNKEDVYFIRSK